jgi:hypothetical protein
MGRQGESYRHLIPELDLSIERNTSKVPADGKFHIVKSGVIMQSFRSRKLAEERFRQLVTESGFKPKTPESTEVSLINESIERYSMAKDIFWAEGPKYRSRGGRGGRGGV